MAKKTTKTANQAKTENKNTGNNAPKLNLNIPKLKKLIEEAAEDDDVLAKALEREDKNFEGCCNYIVQQVLDGVADRVVRGGGFQFVAEYIDPKTVLGWAIHYYTEDDVELEDILKKAQGMVAPEPKKEEKKATTKKVGEKNTPKVKASKKSEELDILSIGDIDDVSDEAIMSFELF